MGAHLRIRARGPRSCLSFNAFRTLCKNIGIDLICLLPSSLPNNSDRYRNSMWRHARILVTSLIPQHRFKIMLTRLRRQVSMQYKLPRIHAELFARSDLQSKIRATRKIHGRNSKPRCLHHSQPSRDQRLVQRRVRVDMQSIGNAEVKIDLRRVTRRNRDPFRIKKLYRGRRIGPLARVTRQWQRLVLEHLQQRRRQPRAHQPRAEHYRPPAARAFLILASTSSFETNPAVSATTLPSLPTK